MAGRVQDKVVVVTGAAQGIGYGCAELLAREGARVVLADLQVEKGEAAAAAIREAGGEALFHRVDVREEGDCAGLMTAAVGAYGRLDGLVNNVGWFPRGTLEETTTDLWEQVLNVNLRSAFYCCKHAVPHLRSAGGGSIVNVGSVHGIQGQANLVAYSAAKGGLLALTRTVAGAFSADRIRANYVIPGWVLTEGEMERVRSEGLNEEEFARQGQQLRLGRHQTPLDTAYAVVYLVSDESSQVTGSIMHLDAGASTLLHSPKDEYRG